jgi:hypothetical protein
MRIPKRYSLKNFFGKFPEVKELVSEPYELWFAVEESFKNFDLSKPKEIYKRVGAAVYLYCGKEDYMFNKSNKKWESIDSKYVFESDYAHQNRYQTNGKTVLEVIDAEDININQIKYIATVHYGLEIVNHTSIGKGVCLYALNNDDRERIKNTIQKRRSVWGA